MNNASSERFNKIAGQYLNSEVHKMSQTIKNVHEKSADWEIESICDVACGAGHFGLSFSNRTSNITAIDPSKNMLETAKSLAIKNGISNYKTVQGLAEDLPLPDGSFDLVISRLAPHHFIDIQKAINEMYRITKPGGYIVIIDLAGYDNNDIDQFNHRIEVLHDPTHIKSYSAKEWENLLKNEFDSFEVIKDQSESQVGVSVKRWCEIASSGEIAEKAIREALSSAPLKYLEEMSIKKVDDEYYFPIKTNAIYARKGKI